MPIFPSPNVSGFVDVFKYVNNVTKYDYANDPSTMPTFGIVIIFIIFCIAFISMKNWGDTKAFTAASFTTMMSAMLLSLIELVPVFVVPITIVMLIFSVFLLGRQE